MTRLYPITTNPSKLETLAGVPAGTYEALNRIKAATFHLSGGEQFDLLQEHPDCARLDNFLIFGFGRLLVNVDLLAGKDPVCGSTKDFDICADIRSLQFERSGDPAILRATFDLTEGFAWS